MQGKFYHSVVAAAGLVLSLGVQATQYELPEAGSVIGAPRVITAAASDTLLDIAKAHNLGYEALKLANPGVDTWLPGAGRRINLPTQFVLPKAPRRGIVLNLAEMRLYYYPRPRRGERPTVITHPVSIGRYDWETPLGRTRIVSKVRDPAWYPPKSIRAEHEAAGDPLPAVVPAGPDNPLGAHAMRLDRRGYLIHGTNKPYGIGMRASHGCIRMYPEDIAALFEIVPNGTPVHIVNQPVKVGRTEDGELLIEAHPKEGEHEGRAGEGVRLDQLKPLVISRAGDNRPGQTIDWDIVVRTVADRSGMPVAVSKIDSAVEEVVNGRLAGLSLSLNERKLAVSGQPRRVHAHRGRPHSEPPLELRLTY